MSRKLINYYLKGKGLTVAPRNGPNMAAAFERLHKRGIPLETIIDVGASNGNWSEKLMPYYPKARYLCVEAQSAHETGLKKFTAQHPNAEYVLAAAGEKEGKIYFDASDLFGGLASDTPFEKDNIEVPVTTVDHQVAQRGLKPPFLIKLDTHGYELPILAGATRTLEKTEVLIIEVYNFDIAPTAVRFAELCVRLEAKGFRCIDLFDVMYRPRDNALWQMDFVFIRSDRSEFQFREYQ